MSAVFREVAKGLYNYYIDDNVPRVHNISFIINRLVEKLNIEVEEQCYYLFDKLIHIIYRECPSFKENIRIGQW